MDKVKRLNKEEVEQLISSLIDQIAVSISGDMDRETIIELTTLVNLLNKYPDIHERLQTRICKTQHEILMDGLLNYH